MSVPTSQAPSLAFLLTTGSGETTFSSAVPRVSSGFLSEGSVRVGTAGVFSLQPEWVVESSPAVYTSQTAPP